MSTRTIKLDVQQMVGFLMGLDGASMFLSMETATPFKLNKFSRAANKADKKPCPWSSVTKLAARLGWLNIDYKAAVERRISKTTGIPAKHIDYELGEVWHKHLLTEEGKPTPVLVNKETPENGKFYIFYFHRKTTAARYVGPNGEPITYEQMKLWLPAPSADNPNKPPVRSITLNNVRVLKARGLIVKGK